LYHLVEGEHRVALCLACYSKVAAIKQQEFDNNARLMNFALEHMDAAIGFGPATPRFPIGLPSVIVEGMKLNNIHVTNSIVGTINTGSIGSIDQSISALRQFGEQDIAESLKVLSETVLRSQDLTREQVNSIVESLSVISREAASPPEKRQSSVALTLLEKAEKYTSMANDISGICSQHWPVLVSFFQVATGA